MNTTRLMYCFKCKIKTNTTNVSQLLTENKRTMIKGLCEDCNTTKCKIIPTESLIPGSGGLTLKTGAGLEDSKDVKNSKDKKSLEILEKAYYSPKTGFCGINELQRQTKKPIKEVKQFLNQQDVYTLHKPARKNFKSQRVYFDGIDDQWQSDLVEMIPYADENKGYKYLLTIIDCFSKFAWVEKLKTKSGEETADALSMVFERSKRKLKKMQTDNGKEYYSSSRQKLFKSLEINHFSTYSDKKASIIKRFNRTKRKNVENVYSSRKS